jgi:CBS domain-containing protein
MAFLADNGRYAGSLTADDLTGDDSARPAAQLARSGPTITPDAPAQAAYELAIATDAHRIPVIDNDGILVGVVGVTDDLAAFCGTS